MNKIKTSLLLMIAILVMGILAACGQDSSTSADSDESGDSKEEKVYIIATDAKYAPFSFEEDGEYRGIDVELIAAIAEDQGFKYELKPMDFSGIIPGIVSGQIDASIAGMNITEERAKQVDFSDGYIEAASSIVAHKDNTDINSLEDLQGKTAAVKKGTTGAAFAEENQEKYDLKVSYYDDSPSMKAAVENGNADFMVEDYPVISYQIKTDTDSKLKVAVEEIGPAPQDGFAVKKGENQDLLSKFNEGLKNLRENGEYDRIVGQYLSVE